MDEQRQKDDLINSFIRKFRRLPRQYQEWFYIAAFESDREYEAMMRTVTKENERKWLAEIRECFRKPEKKSKRKRPAPKPTKAKG